MAAPKISNLSAIQREATSRLQGTDSGGISYAVEFSNISTATSATAGSASALPSPPAGYLYVLVNGSAVGKIPFYNA